MNKIQEQSAKMTVISNIRQMQDKAGIPLSTFEELNVYSLEHLREVQGTLIPLYNDAVRENNI